MKYSKQELTDIAYSYFARGVGESDPRYKQGVEYDRRMAARVPARARYRDWCAMLARVQARFPTGLRDIGVENKSLFLAGAGAAALDRCFTGALWLPDQSPAESHHQLEFVVSFVVPYYAVRSSHFEEDPTPLLPPSQRARLVFQGDTCYIFPPDPNAVADPNEKPRYRRIHRFEFSAAEEPFARGIAEEIETTFPGHEPISPEVGLTVVPEVEAGNKTFGEATIFTCLFADEW